MSVARSPSQINVLSPGKGPAQLEVERSEMENLHAFRSPRESIFSNFTSYPRSLLDAYTEELSPEASSISHSCFDASEDEPRNSTAGNTSKPCKLLFGKRYKMSMTLKPRETELARSSWSILLDNECSKQKYDDFINNILKKPKKRVQNAKLGAIAGDGVFSSFLFGTQFLANILEFAPEIEDAFPTINHAATAVTGVLTAAVDNLEDLSVLDEYLCGLGKRHSRILGVCSVHFRVAGAGFMKTLRDRFGYDMTRELENVWLRLYLYLSNTMLQFGIDPVIVDNEISSMVLEPPAVLERQPTTTSNESSNKSDFSQEPISLRSGGSSERSHYTTSSGSFRFSSSILRRPSSEGHASGKTQSTGASSSSSRVPKSVRGGGGNAGLKTGGKWVPVSALPKNTYTKVVIQETSHKGGSVRGGGSSYKLVRMDASQMAGYTAKTSAETQASIALQQRREQMMREYAARSGGARGGGGDCSIM
ncbi:LAFA_0G24454g1_1 [Lachancea sp. 'fantastica']|nr:LAFA_0G24454g1_1 [Lachancea sp. 'fantastica']